MGDETQVGTDTSVDANADTSVVDTTEGMEETEKLRTLAENYKIRAEKAEAKLRAKPETKQESSTQITKEQTQNETLPPEVLKLYAKGLDDDQVEYVQKVAVLEGKSLKEASESDLYTTWNEKRAQRLKDEKAQLRASNGSRVAVKKDFKSGSLSEDEHKALYKEKYG